MLTAGLEPTISSQALSEGDGGVSQSHNPYSSQKVMRVTVKRGKAESTILELLNISFPITKESWNPTRHFWLLTYCVVY